MRFHGERALGEEVMIRTRVIGTGSYLPERVISNSELAGPLHLTSDRIERLTGIRERRWAADYEATSDLAIQAGQRALAAASLPATSVDMVVVSTTSSDMAFPSTACYVQRGLGCQGVGAFDVSASCSGFLYGLSMANAAICSRQVRTCLVVASEIKSRFLDPADADTALLFGDGAGAVVLRAEEDCSPQSRGILGLRLYSDGSRHDLLRIPAGGSRRPSTGETVAAGEHVLHMQGAALFRVAIRRIEQAVQDMLKEFGVRLEDIKQVVLHQANGRILSQLADRLGLAPEQFSSVIARYGNTSSASVPIALDAAVQEGKIAAGDLVLLGSFGGGLTWATGLVRW
jgi:3-oxoacyl-[acyl-carrier-protein] synthase-3